MKLAFFMVKPDAVLAGYTEKIISHLKEIGLEILAQKRKILTREDVAFLYPMHVNEVFFDDLVAFMVSSPSELFIVKKDSVVDMLNRIVGTTDPNNGKGWTLRKKFGTDLRHNAVHSPNSQESAVRELLYFFPEWHWFE